MKRDSAHSRPFAPLAAGVDREQEFSHAMWDELQAMGIFGLSFPEEHGGVGASTSAYIAALEEIAYASGVAALYPGTTVQVARSAAAPRQRRSCCALGWTPDRGRASRGMGLHGATNGFGS
ncbi:acyl-CoA dehydrogenase family protein [Aeromicrobium sp. UC242_57]|uniref:acyl-CoA dehydrogenase family protein n=1 Tax=Aeromicrobium sp. UC242_57 TaxID=3374624 RepID=UPI003790BB13